MKVLFIGRPGAGKSTLARRLQSQTHWPLLALDRLWHATDYSDAAKVKFIAQQKAFIAAHDDWIIDGNYAGSLAVRLPEADVVVMASCNRFTAVSRVIRRSLRYAKDPQSRPDMAPGFVEHFDRDYLEFLQFVWGFDEAALQSAVENHARLLVVRTPAQKQAAIAQLIHTI